MGNTLTLPQAQQLFPSNHIRIYLNLIQIRDPYKRLEMIEVLLQQGDYVASAKKAGVYSHLQLYVYRLKKGENPGLLPGEGGGGAPVQQQQPQRQQHTTIVSQEPRARNSYEQIARPRAKEKAIGYFQSCLEVLGLEEEVALTEDSLKKAYKVAALRAHPDKGGDEDRFEAVTRAYAYLSEILKRIHGGRTTEGKVDTPTVLKDSRHKESAAWQHVEPVRLNPKKLDMDAFNKMFEQTRIPDPDEDGYGDWLTAKGSEEQKKFSGKFNRDVFNKAFEDASRGQHGQNTQLMMAPQALTLAPSAGVELGRDRPQSYTSAMNLNASARSSDLNYTDLKQAYTLDNTFSGQVANVRVDVRDIKSYQASRERAPDPLSNSELEQISASEKAMADRESKRQIRAAQEHVMANDYFERMKRLVITNQ